MAASTSITAKPGRDFTLKVSDEQSPTTYITIGGLRNTQVTINNNPIDITNVDSNGFREWLQDGGIQDLSISADGIFDSATTGATEVWETAIDRDRLIECQLVSGHGDSLFFSMVINSYQRNGPYDGAETFSFSGTSHGRIARVAA